jgi:hypothetical protein
MRSQRWRAIAPRSTAARVIYLSRAHGGGSARGGSQRKRGLVTATLSPTTKPTLLPRVILPPTWSPEECFACDDVSWSTRPGAFKGGDYTEVPCNLRQSAMRIDAVELLGATSERCEDAFPRTESTPQPGHSAVCFASIHDLIDIGGNVRKQKKQPQ